MSRERNRCMPSRPRLKSIPGGVPIVSRKIPTRRNSNKHIAAGLGEGIYGIVLLFLGNLKCAAQARGPQPMQFILLASMQFGKFWFVNMKRTGGNAYSGLGCKTCFKLSTRISKLSVGRGCSRVAN